MLGKVLSRRQFISGTAQVALGTVLLNGCGGMTVAQIVIPAIAGVTLQELYNVAKALFKEKMYAAGDTHNTLLATLQGVEIYQDPLAAELLQQFKGTVVENQFCTPILLYRRGLNRFLQLAQEGSYWSLLTGGPANTGVFKVHQTWLEWLIEDDNCNLVINGNSSYEQCGLGRCPITITKQSFLDVNNQEVKLQFDVSDPSYSSAAVDYHRKKHVQKWLGCPAVEGQPDKCV